MKTDKDTPKGLPGHKDSLRIEGKPEQARISAPIEVGDKAADAMMNAQDYTTYGFTASPKTGNRN